MTREIKASGYIHNGKNKRFQKKMFFFINKVRNNLPVLNALPEPVNTITRHVLSMFNCSKHVFNSLKKIIPF